MTQRDQLTAFIEEFSAGMPPGVINHLRECVAAGELRLALEEACAYLGELNKKLTPLQVQTVKRLGGELGVDAKWWRTISQE